jgi:hypothetical protein
MNVQVIFAFFHKVNNKNNLLYPTQRNLAKICFLQSRAIVQSNPSLFGSGNQRATSIIYSVALK